MADPWLSKREKRLWGWTLLLVGTIYATLGLAGSLAGMLGDGVLNASTFVVGSMLVVVAVVTFGLRDRPDRTEVMVGLGIAAVYVLVLTRLTSPVERSHLVEYGVVALLIHAALLERKASGGRVPAPALTAIAAAIVVGTVDELIQLLVSNRVFDPVDIGFNAVAAAMAVSAAEVMVRVRRRRSQRT